MWVLDAKRVEFLDFRTWPNVEIVAGSIPQQVTLVRRVWELMEYRYQLIEEGKATVNDFEPLVAFLDEFAEFPSNLLELKEQVSFIASLLPTQVPSCESRLDASAVNLRSFTWSTVIPSLRTLTSG